MKILAVKLRAIGDTVIWTSALEKLHEQLPKAELHVLTYASNNAVLMNNPHIHKRHYLKTRGKFEFLQKMWSLRTEEYDWLLLFHATTSQARFAWLSGAENKAIHHHSWTYTPMGSVDIFAPGKLEDAISRDYQVVRAIGLEASRKVPTKIFVTKDEAAVAEQKIQKRIKECGGIANLPRFIFAPGASHHLRRYPKDLWLPLIKHAQEESSFQPIVMCDQELSQEWNLKEECRNLNVPLFDRESLREFITLMSRGQRCLANDSGPGHIAVALGLRTEFVFGPGCVGDWFPYDDSLHRVHRIEVDCRLNGPPDNPRFQFCTVNECSHHKCLRCLTVTF
jgi:heptosyltransferase-2